MAERGSGFGSVAADYERFRPGYPDELVDEILAYAGRPTRTALEIGAGTGKATRVFAARGIAVTATDPDAAMLAELRRRVPDRSGLGVATVCSPFEDLTLDATFDLVLAAASMHWTAPAGRWERVSARLVPDGVVACFGGPLSPRDDEVEAAARAARSPELADDDVAPSGGTTGRGVMRWPGAELAESGLFTDVRESVIERRLFLTAQEYVDHLSTISAYLALPVDVRRRVLDRIREALPERLEVTADLTLHLARRR